MTDLEQLSTQELKAILDETEQRIHEIRAELEEREADTQHTLVESIELSPEWTPVKWGQVKAFFSWCWTSCGAKSHDTERCSTWVLVRADCRAAGVPGVRQRRHLG
ncbi:hypothetical protein ULF88_14855 [Halopseudomonas pachastrellae]|nr:hypothetical protein [Halopseudomonas pachastrellae]